MESVIIGFSLVGGSQGNTDMLLRGKVSIRFFSSHFNVKINDVHSTSECFD